MKFLRILFFLPVIALLAACQPDLGPNTYDYYGGTGGSVREGVVQDIQYNVRVNKNSGGGSIAGGVGGAIIGSNLGGGNGLVGAVGMVGGAVVGSMAGNAIENSASTSQATLYIIRLRPSKRLVSVIQQSPVPLCIGDHVYVMLGGDRTRLRLNEQFYESGEHTRSGCLQKQKN